MAYANMLVDEKKKKKTTKTETTITNPANRRDVQIERQKQKTKRAEIRAKDGRSVMQKIFGSKVKDAETPIKKPMM